MDILRKNQIYTVVIDGYSSEAAGVCHIDGCAVFVPGTIPGERWEIKIVKVSKTAVFARAEKLLAALPCRQNPECRYYGKCGGCDTWHMSYEEELRFKLGRVNDALHRIGKQTFTASEIIGGDSIYHYRNKGIYAFAPKDGKAVFGFYRERSHDIIEIDECLIQDEQSVHAAKAVADFCNGNSIPAYNEADNTGIVRHVFYRHAVTGTDAMLCVVARKGFGSLTQTFVEHMRARCPELTGIVLNINKSTGNTVLSGDFYTLWGKGSISDVLCGSEFEIAPQAFFQINPPQAQKLYERAAEYAALTNDDLAFDLYCGAGTISLRLARDAGKVIGAEIVPEAIENAKENAARNNIGNAEFICADAGAAAMQLAARQLRPKVICVDPPRKGMSPATVDAVASMQPERIVYVSCDPATLARDILRFSQLGYELKKATAVDMFPRTSHVETVVLMTRI